MGKNPEHQQGICEHILEAVSDYIDGEAAVEMCEEINRHLEKCENCENFIDSVKKVVQLYSRDRDCMPDGAKEFLHKTLKEQCSKMQDEK